MGCGPYGIYSWYGMIMGYDWYDHDWSWICAFGMMSIPAKAPALGILGYWDGTWENYHRDSTSRNSQDIWFFYYSPVAVLMGKNRSNTPSNSMGIGVFPGFSHDVQSSRATVVAAAAWAWSAAWSRAGMRTVLWNLLIYRFIIDVNHRSSMW